MDSTDRAPRWFAHASDGRVVGIWLRPCGEGWSAVAMLEGGSGVRYDRPSYPAALAHAIAEAARLVAPYPILETVPAGAPTRAQLQAALAHGRAYLAGQQGATVAHRRAELAQRFHAALAELADPPAPYAAAAGVLAAENERLRAALARLADPASLAAVARDARQFGSAGARLALDLVQKMAARVLAGGAAQDPTVDPDATRT